MTTYVVSPNGNDSTGTGTPSRPWKNFAPANRVVAPGDSVEIVDGSYFDAILPARSGEPDAPITYYAAGDNTLLRGKATLNSRAFINLIGLNFASRYAGMLGTDRLSSDYAIENCTFNSELGTQDFSFVGIRIDGMRPKFANNKLLTWYGGDFIQWWASEGLYRDVDASQVRSAHGVLMIYNGSRNIVTGDNPITNPWGRTGCVLRTGTIGCERNLIEGLNVVNSGWDGVVATPGSAHHGGTGDQQQLQVGGRGTIIRRCSFLNNKPGAREAQSYYSTLQVAGRGSSTGEVSEFSHMRIYGNEAHNNPIPFFSLTYANDMTNMHAEDIRVQYNDISDIEATHIRPGVWEESLRISDNTRALANWPVTVESVNGDVVTVSDAWGLHPGSAHWGIQGDELRIGNQAVRVVEWIDDKKVRVAPTPVVVPPVVVEPEPTPEPTPVRVEVRVWVNDVEYVVNATEPLQGSQ